MNLFFETSRQANCFLCMIPLGIAVALLLDISLAAAKIRVISDVLVFVLAGIAVLMAVVFCGEVSLRLYHMLGFLTGSLLYMQGIGKIIRRLWRRQELKQSAAK